MANYLICQEAAYKEHTRIESLKKKDETSQSAVASPEVDMELKIVSFNSIFDCIPKFCTRPFYLLRKFFRGDGVIGIEIQLKHPHILHFHNS